MNGKSNALYESFGRQDHPGTYLNHSLESSSFIDTDNLGGFGRSRVSSSEVSESYHYAVTQSYISWFR